MSDFLESDKGLISKDLILSEFTAAVLTTVRTYSLSIFSIADSNSSAISSFSSLGLFTSSAVFK
eukprot:CAMPEP_0184472228 /NCGR_PEP_ID=MMETSP0740-20130409/109597_1 /TAXON_ID=385413 /ORGANISM="Thalassiosira miniscula, Strain CCMP1093" /LENGTH=63 /DNA_ID=CAMNT_0026848827 /DNA_START=161 /DNA_END=349 /DNA_ORIENTATION=+